MSLARRADGLRVEQSHQDFNVEEEQGEANDDEVGPLRFDQLSREMQDLLRCGICTDFDRLVQQSCDKVHISFVFVRDA